MKMSVLELTGDLLNWAVATCCLNRDFNSPEYSYGIDGRVWAKGLASRAFNPAGSWEDGGPLLEANQISITQFGGAWKASSLRQSAVLGSTMLEAAMRCLVCSKVGSSVEVPDILLADIAARSEMAA